MGIVALAVFIGVAVVINVVMKRDISEALLMGLVAVAALGGKDFFHLLKAGVIAGAQNEVLFAGLAFVFMGAIVNATGLIDRLIAILNSMFGRVRGGAGYVSTLGSAMIGLVAGSTAGNSATVGSVTVPWMKKTGWSSERAATLVAGNSGLGVALPPNSTMFIILALPAAMGATASSVYVALACAGAYAVLYRLLLVAYWAKKFNLPMDTADTHVPLKQSFKEGWSSPAIFWGILIPVFITIGPLAQWLSQPEHVGDKALKAVSIIVWVPILISVIAVIEGFKHLKNDIPKLKQNVVKEIPQFATVGISLFAALGAAEIMDELGVGDELSALLGSLDLPKILMIALVAVLTIIVATPLSSTATAAAVGAPAMAALTAVGLDPTLAVIVILLCSSTEGASPPVGAPIYLSAAMADAEPSKMFVPLVAWFVVPMVLLAVVIGMGWLPIYIPAG
ncbi:TRAP transporter large permease subunit [Corynebacterium belfantii]|uniref:TRAP transporter large permease subunit n=1 Tax=Corynebacterium belfantii TaxID=2014537 RepID=A0ABS0LAH6_9CORY|nr:TRAP transporter large permease subunit [Corynebacterium belfantii]MBG9258668.1 TRAP transporter large permease subunit [Corynebacterium belfantii]MBG9265411.1 TRAP transporter large permease subunit [Corynebacterium belfantii]MBG9299048.1 TRAP transporter large permease subunit [Corynebacterium belfantii]MBG9308363.1 TRAP transporter large permease subunit [Corynebacterium belfantii]MBG9346644.1 TRAP transporter large permease subunit [Corynebacterium belfantii]